MQERLELLALDRARQIEPNLLHHDCVAVVAIRTPLKAGGRWVATAYCCEGSLTFECGALAASARSVH